MNKIKRGDVVKFTIPFSPDSHIQGGFRPWLVVQNDVGNANSPCTVVVPMTSKIRRLDIPSHVPVVWKGLQPSMVECEQIRIVDNQEDAWEFVCTLPQEIMEHIDHALMSVFFNHLNRGGTPQERED